MTYTKHLFNTWGHETSSFANYRSRHRWRAKKLNHQVRCRCRGCRLCMLITDLVHAVRNSFIYTFRPTWVTAGTFIASNVLLPKELFSTGCDMMNWFEMEWNWNVITQHLEQWVKFLSTNFPKPLATSWTNRLNCWQAPTFFENDIIMIRWNRLNS